MKVGFGATRTRRLLAAVEMNDRIGADRPTAAGGNMEKLTFNWPSSPCQEAPAPGSGSSARVTSNHLQPRRLTLGQPTDLLLR